MPLLNFLFSVSSLFSSYQKSTPFCSDCQAKKCPDCSGRFIVTLWLIYCKVDALYNAYATIPPPFRTKAHPKSGDEHRGFTQEEGSSSRSFPIVRVHFLFQSNYESSYPHFLTKNPCGHCCDLVLTPTSWFNFISGGEFLKASLSCRNLVSN